MSAPMRRNANPLVSCRSEPPQQEERTIASALAARVRAEGMHKSLRRLLFGHYRRFTTFLAVGLVGVVVANGGLVLVREAAHLNVFLAGSISWQAAILATFTLNTTITWRGARGRSLPARFAAFEMVSLIGLAIYLGTIAVAQGPLHLHYVAGGLAGSGIAAIWNYTANHVFTFVHRAEPLRDAA
jgi:putative flippase GtrA